jgi:hypothetical protein
LSVLSHCGFSIQGLEGIMSRLAPTSNGHQKAWLSTASMAAAFSFILFIVLFVG